MRSLAFGVVRRLAHALRASSVVWLMFVLTQPVTLQACPLQSDMALMTHGQSAQRVLAEGGALCDPSHDGTGQDASHGTGSHESAPANQCHCVGTCCVAMMASPSIGASVVPVPTAIAVLRDRYPAVTRVVPAPEYTLPPATAPPLA